MQHDSEIPAEGQQVITACMLMYRWVDEQAQSDESTGTGHFEIFLAQRALTKKFLPGVWELPGGHIDYGESIQEGLIREVHEEFGITIEVEECIYAFDYLNEIKGSHSAEIIYLARQIGDDEIKLDPADHADSIWVSAENLDELLGEKAKAEDPEYKAIKHGFKMLKLLAKHS